MLENLPHIVRSTFTVRDCMPLSALPAFEHFPADEVFAAGFSDFEGADVFDDEELEDFLEDDSVAFLEVGAGAASLEVGAGAAFLVTTTGSTSVRNVAFTQPTLFFSDTWRQPSFSDAVMATLPPSAMVVTTS